VRHAATTRRIFLLRFFLDDHILSDQIQICFGTIGCPIAIAINGIFESNYLETTHQIPTSLPNPSFPSGVKDNTAPGY
jgi:hypothetical protein